MDRTFLQERIVATKELIVAYEGAVAALAAANGVQYYTFDTGQDKQTVTRADVPSLGRMIGSLYNRLATLEARLYGSGVSQARPNW